MDEMQTWPPSSQRVWLPGIVENIAHFLSPNVIACTLVLVDKATREQFRGHTVVRLSLPSPPHAFVWRWGSASDFRGLTRKRRLQLLCLTAASGCIANLEVALDNAGLVRGREAVAQMLETAAAGAGQLEACKLLRARGYFYGIAVPAAAARGGHRHVCEWALASGCPVMPYTVRAAAQGGHEGLMRWLLLQFCEANGTWDVDSAALLMAGVEGLDLAAFQRLYQQELMAEGQPAQEAGDGGGEARGQAQWLDPSQQEGLLAAAAGSPTPDWQAKVEWLEELGCPRTAHAGTAAAERGPAGDAVGRLRWLHARGYPLDADTAALRGDLAGLRFLVEQAGVMPTQWVHSSIAGDGHLAVLQYLHGLGQPLDAGRCAGQAAKGGHLPVVAWTAEALGVTPTNTPYLLYHAAKSGCVELMAWLRERGWGWAGLAVTNTVFSGCEEALEWLVQQGCPWPAGGGLYIEASSLGDLAMIRCLHRLGCPWDGGRKLLAVCMRARASLPALRLLVELGCPEQDWRAAVKAVKVVWPLQCRAALLQWLGEERQRLKRSRGFVCTCRLM